MQPDRDNQRNESENQSSTPPIPTDHLQNENDTEPTEENADYRCHQCGQNVVQELHSACPRCATLLDWPEIRREREPSSHHAVRNASLWTMVGFVISQVLRLGNNILLARLLYPEAFGVMGLVNTFYTGLVLFSDLGSGPMVVQSPRSDRAFLNTIWTVQVLRGFWLWLGMVILAYPVALLYDEPSILPLIPILALGAALPLLPGATLNIGLIMVTQIISLQADLPSLLWLLPVCGLTAIITALESTNIESYERRLHVGRVTLIRLAAQFLSIVVMLGLAWYHSSIWAIVIGSLTASIVQTGLSYLALSGPWNRFAWDKETIQELFTFGRWIFLSTVISYLASQFDRLLLGLLLAKGALGYYFIALNLTGLPSNALSQLASTVLYPVLSQQKRVSHAAFAATFAKARALLLDVARLLVLGLVVAAPAFFGLLYKPEYAPAAWITQTVCLALWWSLLQESADRALLAAGDTRAMMFSNLARFLATTLACLLGYHLGGLMGFLLGMAVGAFAGYWVVARSLARSWQIPIFTDDARATLRLALPVTIAVVLTDLLFPHWGFSMTASSIIASAVLLPFPLYRTARLLLQTLRQRGETVE